MTRPDSLRLELDIRRIRTQARVGGHFLPSSRIVVQVTGPNGQRSSWTRDSLEEAMATVGRRHEQFVPSLPETPEEELAALKAELAEVKMWPGINGFVVPYSNASPFKSPRLAKILREARG